MSRPAKFILWIVGVIVALGLIFFLVVGPILKKNTKKHSPEQQITYTQGDLVIDLFYSSPGKKGRAIFGELVPYGEVWRTGANEATTFTTNKDLLIDGKTLEAGTYTLWTIPREDSWSVIFNRKMYSWGVRWQDSKAMREAEHDALVVDATVSESISVQEDFSINVIEGENGTMVLLFSWDQVVVPLQMQVK
ncbi:MAG: DUF2911 domain-containing protein [Bacteroidia bacterium]|nr:DUF2911 domain-containing protein [Bacteroidia bacterium]NNM22508.1 DUF2911 domain-containing protein [Flavobacteriaceae bacterium]